MVGMSVSGKETAGTVGKFWRLGIGEKPGIEVAKSGLMFGIGSIFGTLRLEIGVAKLGRLIPGIWIGGMEYCRFAGRDRGAIWKHEK